jgi:hypothetical protein
MLLKNSYITYMLKDPLGRLHENMDSASLHPKLLNAVKDTDWSWVRVKVTYKELHDGDDSKTGS